MSPGNGTGSMSCVIVREMVGVQFDAWDGPDAGDLLSSHESVHVKPLLSSAVVLSGM